MSLFQDSPQESYQNSKSLRVSDGCCESSLVAEPNPAAQELL